MDIHAFTNQCPYAYIIISTLLNPLHQLECFVLLWQLCHSPTSVRLTVVLDGQHYELLQHLLLGIMLRRSVPCLQQDGAANVLMIGVGGTRVHRWTLLAGNDTSDIIGRLRPFDVRRELDMLCSFISSHGKWIDTLTVLNTEQKRLLLPIYHRIPHLYKIITFSLSLSSQEELMNLVCLLHHQASRLFYRLTLRGPEHSGRSTMLRLVHGLALHIATSYLDYCTVNHANHSLTIKGIALEPSEIVPVQNVRWEMDREIPVADTSLNILSDVHSNGEHLVFIEYCLQ